MRVGGLAAALLLLAVGDASAGPAPDPVAPWVAKAVAAGGLAISTAPEGSLLGRLTWASWTEGDPMHWMVHLVLMRRAGSAEQVVWSVERPDGYMPVLRPTPWDVAGHPVLMLQYQYGAAYTRAEFYALRANGQPALLDSVEGSLIEVVGVGNDTGLKAHDTADLQGAPRCYGWDAPSSKLKEAGC